MALDSFAQELQFTRLDAPHTQIIVFVTRAMTQASTVGRAVFPMLSDVAFMVPRKILEEAVKHEIPWIARSYINSTLHSNWYRMAPAWTCLAPSICKFPSHTLRTVWRYDKSWKLRAGTTVIKNT